MDKYLPTTTLITLSLKMSNFGFIKMDLNTTHTHTISEYWTQDLITLPLQGKEISFELKLIGYTHTYIANIIQETRTQTWVRHHDTINF